MDKEKNQNIGVFFETPSATCSYFPGERIARQMAFLEPLRKPTVTPLNDVRKLVKELIPHGFLDGGFSAKFNACSGCKKCFPVRINLAEFTPSRSQRRILKRNQDLSIEMKSMRDERGVSILEREHFNLMHHNATNRHPGGWFTTMGYESFRHSFSVYDMVAETRDAEGKLMNFTVLSVGDNYVYGINFFYDVVESQRRSLGKHTILALTEALKEVESVEHFYLGSLAQDSPKLSYKGEFSGLEAMTDQGWVSYNAEKDFQTPDYTELVPQDVYWPYRNAHKYTNG